jgi:3-oxoacyl-[acyl-carrier protein] reductase
VSSERRALVTGSSSGIGRTIAQALLADGWHVSGLDVAPAAISHGRFVPIVVDLCDGSAAAAAATAALPLHALVHSAGVMRPGALGEYRQGDAELMWRLHVEAIQRIANSVLPAMAAARNGRVVLIGSRTSGGKASRGQYTATKAALVALARSWAAEVVAAGVTVNVVSPAATETAMLADPLRAGEKPVLPPLGRLIRPDEVAALVLYLLGPWAGAITGQDIRICGGASLPQ